MVRSGCPARRRSCRRCRAARSAAPLCCWRCGRCCLPGQRQHQTGPLPTSGWIWPQTSASTTQPIRRHVLQSACALRRTTFPFVPFVWVPHLHALSPKPASLPPCPPSPQLRAAAALLQDALNVSDVAQEEALWSKIILEYGGLDSNWVPDLVGRAWGEAGWVEAEALLTVRLHEVGALGQQCTTGGPSLGGGGVG